MSGMLDAKKKSTKNGAAQREKFFFFLAVTEGAFSPLLFLLFIKNGL